MKKNTEQNKKIYQHGDIMTDSVIKQILDSNTKNTELLLNEFNRVYDKMEEDKKELTDKIDSLRTCVNKNEVEQSNKYTSQLKDCSNKFATWKVMLWLFAGSFACIGALVSIIINLHTGA